MMCSHFIVFVRLRQPQQRSGVRTPDESKRIPSRQSQCRFSFATENEFLCHISDLCLRKHCEHQLEGITIVLHSHAASEEFGACMGCAREDLPPELRQFNFGELQALRSSSQWGDTFLTPLAVGRIPEIRRLAG
jgi:hypothetical protein